MFAIGPLPIAGIVLMMGMLEIKNEAHIWSLTKSMGMRPLSWVLAGLIGTTVTVIIGGAILVTTWSFVIFKAANPSILVVTILPFTYASFF